MIKRADVVKAAKRWVDTPFAHQGRIRGQSCDCAGLIACVGRELRLTSFDMTTYGREPNPKAMKAILDRELIEIPLSESLPGDIFWCVHGSPKPRHLAIFTGATLIHAFEGAGKCVEHRLDDKWRRRIRAAYRYPGLG